MYNNYLMFSFILFFFQHPFFIMVCIVKGRDAFSFFYCHHLYINTIFCCISVSFCLFQNMPATHDFVVHK